MLDENEYWKLLDVIEAAERFTTGPRAGNSLFGEFISNAKSRIEHLEKEGNIAGGKKQEKKKQTQATNYAVAALVQQELRLTATERQQYGSFLEKNFFTRDDFGKLDHFYGSAWDRLTDDGKSQMSHRVWEGIREGEYEFTDLPENAKKKEAEYLYSMFTGQREMPPAMHQIPERDQQDFILAMETENEEQAFSVLNRKSFKETVSLNPEASPISSPQQQTTKSSPDAAPETEQKTSADISDEMDGFENLDLSAMKKPSELPKSDNKPLSR